ncbi:MAG: 3-methyladenine DNA glycosylase/8-oxoguanine DNA glycosylase [Francisellaceae bacterium]|jgi:3-methyladenine DNA glycosylase/8-oxoguanine DNA glycosylase
MINTYNTEEFYLTYMASDPRIDGTADLKSTCKRLLTMKGVDRWRVLYMAMRTLRNPKSFPESNLILQIKSNN